ncbi:hypothetical protein GCM10010106_50680 [Thermopolyspora flexuosa]|jgi:hypothetical protein|uniref:PknH-like protein n=1 Tax=Thermopolyspora flexuosa TaxID=103836 RepID=A0A543ITL9_9ACTN|nr:hypothetical protein [Thermopolyspora flexuosa]TQM73892.1 hypothetical protein FHX40_0550 [Thermopolyspora flexuosa]GGM95665.1 hypothetical protein GCM10010106_50680 [Thermopolyspora flexuosa]
MSAFGRGTAKAVAALAGAVTLAGLGLAQAATAQAAAAPQQATAEATAFRIPKNFLLHEAEFRKAKKPKETSFSDRRTETRQIDPCGRKRTADGKRVAARTISLLDETELSAEQLIVYSSKREAKKGFAALRADLARCAKSGKGFDRYEYAAKPVRIGDEALLVGLRTFEDSYVHAAVRKGRAIFIYERSGGWNTKFRSKDFGAVERDARRMARKVCSLPGVC